MKLKQRVSGHERMAHGKPVKVSGYKRKVRRQSHKIHKAKPIKIRVVNYIDENGQYVSKRVVKRI